MVRLVVEAGYCRIEGQCFESYLDHLETPASLLHRAPDPTLLWSSGNTLKQLFLGELNIIAKVTDCACRGVSVGAILRSCQEIR